MQHIIVQDQDGQNNNIQDATPDYLEAIFNYKLNWTMHCEALRCKVPRSLTAIKALLRSFLSIKIKLLQLKYYMRLVETYAAPGSTLISKSKMEYLQAVENMVLRLITCYFWYTRIEQTYLYSEISRLMAYLKCLALTSYASTKLIRNRYIKYLESDSIVNDRSDTKPFQLFSYA